MTHHEIGQVLRAIAEPDEGSLVCCQNCFEMYEPVNDDWFCPECVERIPPFELQAKRANIEYWIHHQGDAA